MRFTLSFETAVVFAVLVFSTLATFLYSPFLGLGLVAAWVILLISLKKPQIAILGLAAYFPFESFLLKFVPDDVYVYARFFPEVVLYFLCATVLIDWYSKGERKVPAKPLLLAFGIFAVALTVSSVINVVDPTIAVLGIRQIVRFMFVAITLIFLKPSRKFVERLILVLIAIGLLEGVLGIVQALAGGALDSFLLATEDRNLGALTLSTGVTAFWDEGSRIFATLGRYDRLGNFLYITLLMAVAVVYETGFKKYRQILVPFFIVGIPALLLTFSRASWFSFLIGFVFIGVLLYRDKRVVAGVATGMTLLLSYLALSGLQVKTLTEGSGQTLLERFFETFSYARWSGEYYGLGRVYWFVQTLLVVVPAAPIFGFGPGQYGGGAVAALHNTTVYGLLGLPFGVYGTDGYVDNNWLSIWGEVGTFGLIAFVTIFALSFRYALEVFRKSKNAWSKIVAASCMAIILAISFNAMLSTAFEIRTTGFYVWLLIGLVVSVGALEGISWPKGKKLFSLK